MTIPVDNPNGGMELPARTRLERPAVIWLSMLQQSACILGSSDNGEQWMAQRGMAHRPELAGVLVPVPAITFRFHRGMKWVAGGR